MSPRATPPSDELVRRHLSLPLDAEIDDVAHDRLDSARAWYAANGTPWTQAVTCPITAIHVDVVRLAAGPRLVSPVLARGLERVDAHSLVVVGASAGAEVDAEIDRLWAEGRPDESIFLAAVAAAVAEQLRDEWADRLAAEHAEAGVTVLPHYSPGYAGWRLADQSVLHACLADPGPITVLPSGGLLPKRSTLAVYGLTRRAARRVPAEIWSDPGAAPPSSGPVGRYTIPQRALEKWSRQHLTILERPDDRLGAQFRFQGTTCMNLGVPFTFLYEVELRSSDGGWILDGTSCAPADGDEGHRSTCSAIADREAFETAYREPPPGVGGLLDAALARPATGTTSGCLCLASHREHKWRLVLETVRYALTHRGLAPPLEKESPR